MNTGGQMVDLRDGVHRTSAVELFVIRGVESSGWHRTCVADAGHRPPVDDRAGAT